MFGGVAVTMGDVVTIGDDVTIGDAVGNETHTGVFVKCIESPVTVAPITKPITSPMRRQDNNHFLFPD